MSEANKQKRILETIKRCQRNWTDTRISKELIDHWIWIATNSPSKQYEGYFNLYVIEDSSLIQELLEYTWGFTMAINADVPMDEVPVNSRNPQVGAGVYMLWTQKYPTNSNRNFEYSGVNKSNTVLSRRDNAFTSIGISMALTSYSAASMGYETAYNKNHHKPEHESYWETRLGIDPKVEEIAFGLGIGKGQKDRPHYESDETHIMVGVNKPDYVDVTQTREYTYKGKTYSVMPTITYPTHSKDDRDIVVKRFA